MAKTVVRRYSQYCILLTSSQYMPQGTTVIYANQNRKFVETFTQINRVLGTGFGGGCSSKASRGDGQSCQGNIWHRTLYTRQNTAGGEMNKTC